MENRENASDPIEPQTIPGLLGGGEPGLVAGQPGRCRGHRRGSGSRTAGRDRDRQSGHDAVAEPARTAGRLRSSRSATPSRSTGCADRGSSRRPVASGRRRSMTIVGCWTGPTSTRSSSHCPATSTSRVYRDAIAAGKHLYAEKPLAPSLAGCDRLIALAVQAPRLVVHLGFQRRSNPRFREGVERIQRGELGRLVEARAAWSSSNGPMTGHGGWLGRRERSGDWMVEQAVHIWDVLHWIKGETAGPRQRLGPARSLRRDRPAPRRDRPLRGRAGMGRRIPRLVRPELDRAGRRRLHRLDPSRPGRRGGLRFLRPAR